MKRALICIATCLALVTPTHGAETGNRLPQAMLGAWCPQKDDSHGTPMKRCAPDAPNVLFVTPHAMDNAEGGLCRVVSVKMLSATRWTVAVDCEAEPDRTYGWQFFRDGATLYLTPAGGFVPK
jgi:hypothetical protein